MKLGAIIRSSGERTESLCLESVRKCIDSKNIILLKNVTPFSEAVRKMIVAATEHKFDWYIGVDADVVLKPNWIDMINTVLEGKLNLNGAVELHYKFDFQLQDKFIADDYIFRGLHLYNSKFNSQMLDILTRTKGTSKPEGNIRHKIGAKYFNVLLEYIGYHGYEQYYKDIFNRFVLRAFRNPKYVSRYKLFEGLDKDNVMGKKGWQYGVRNKDKALSMLDARNKIDIPCIGWQEKKQLDMSLEEFYRSVRR